LGDKFPRVNILLFLLNRDQMFYFTQHPSDLGCVLADYGLFCFSEPQADQCCAYLLGASNLAFG
jgi:hypothetical protein